MPTFFDLLKYAKTGIESPGMTAYDKMRALSMAGGGAIKTLTGVPPLSFKANGKPLISWSMLGNGQQNGTPTPDAPIIPDFCGVRTANLFDISSATHQVLGADGSLKYESAMDLSGFIAVDGDYTVSWKATRSGVYMRVSTFDENKNFIKRVAELNAFKNTHYSNSHTGYIRINYENSYGLTDIMLNSGSTALPYEPFGWAEKITCAGQTTPVYLGQTPTVRRIRKLVLTGQETFTYYNTQSSKNVMNLSVPDSLGVTTGNNFVFCTHLPRCTQAEIYGETVERGISTRPNSLILFYDTSIANTPASFKSYLQQQYAAGTPVVVWYVLAEPTTGIVNEPLAKIGDYADELHSTDAGVSIPTVKGSNTLTVETDLQPSSISITGHIKQA